MFVNVSVLGRVRVHSVVPVMVPIEIQVVPLVLYVYQVPINLLRYLVKCADLPWQKVCSYLVLDELVPLLRVHGDVLLGDEVEPLEQSDVIHYVLLAISVLEECLLELSRDILCGDGPLAGGLIGGCLCAVL